MRVVYSRRQPCKCLFGILQQENGWIWPSYVGAGKPPLTEGPNLNMCQAADLGRILVVMVLCSLLVCCGSHQGIPRWILLSLLERVQDMEYYTVVQILYSTLLYCTLLVLLNFLNHDSMEEH